MALKKVLLLDLDDTLISTLNRQFSVLNDFFEQILKKPFCSFEVYKKHKSDNLSNLNIYKRYDLDHAKNELLYQDYFQENIEKEKYLSKDSLLVDMNIFKSLNLKYTLNILSLRKQSNNAMRQMEIMGFTKLIDTFYFLPHEKNDNPKIKKISELKSREIIFAFVGDSESDRKAAESTGVKYFHVDREFNLSDKQSTSINNVLKKL